MELRILCFVLRTLRCRSYQELAVVVLKGEDFHDHVLLQASASEGRYLRLATKPIAGHPWMTTSTSRDELQMSLSITSFRCFKPLVPDPDLRYFEVSNLAWLMLGQS